MVKQWSKLPDTEVEVFCISSNSPTLGKQNLESQISVKAHVVKESPKTIFRMVQSIIWDRMPPFMNQFKASEVGNSDKLVKKNSRILFSSDKFMRIMLFVSISHGLRVGE